MCAGTCVFAFWVRRPDGLPASRPCPCRGRVGGPTAAAGVRVWSPAVVVVVVGSPARGRGSPHPPARAHSFRRPDRPAPPHSTGRCHYRRTLAAGHAAPTQTSVVDSRIFSEKNERYWVGSEILKILTCRKKLDICQNIYNFFFLYIQITLINNLWEFKMSILRTNNFITHQTFRLCNSQKVGVFWEFFGSTNFFFR